MWSLICMLLAAVMSVGTLRYCMSNCRVTLVCWDDEPVSGSVVGVMVLTALVGIGRVHVVLPPLPPTTVHEQCRRHSCGRGKGRRARAPCTCRPALVRARYRRRGRAERAPGWRLRCERTEVVSTEGGEATTRQAEPPGNGAAASRWRRARSEHTMCAH